MMSVPNDPLESFPWLTQDPIAVRTHAPLACNYVSAQSLQAVEAARVRLTLLERKGAESVAKHSRERWEGWQEETKQTQAQSQRQSRSSSL